MVGVEGVLVWVKLGVLIFEGNCSVWIGLIVCCFGLDDCYVYVCSVLEVIVIENIVFRCCFL